MKRTLTFAAAIALLATFGVLGHLRASAPHVPSQTWSPSGAMAAARAGASATLLPGGSVLVAGGLSDGGAVASVEQFSPSADAFFAMPPLQQARANHSATLLQDGRVLVAGGVGADGHAIASAEIYDANTNAWQPAGALAVARAGHTATLLPDGRVLVAGGDDGGVPNAVLELFDPAVGAFAPLDATLTAARTGHAAALAGGKVLIVGGFDGEHALASMDVFDPATNAVAAGAPLAQARAGHSATTLLDGRVLVAGGASDTADLASAEIYDPAANVFVPAGSALTAARQHHLAILLPHNNTVLIVGGSAGGVAVAAAELYVPWEGTGGSFVATGAPGAARAWAAVSALSVPAGDTIRSGPADGLLLLAGGSAAANASTPLASAELYGFATIKTDKSDYAPGTTVTITGDGWQPNEWVTLLLKESPEYDEHPLLAVQADGTGNIVSTEFSPDAHDLNIKFYLTAIGQYSQAQTVFTDSSHLEGVAVGTQSPSFMGPGGTATFPITFTSNGAGTDTVSLTLTGTLPTGASASFSPNPVEFHNASSVLTITTTASTPKGTYPFNVVAGSFSAGGSLVVGVQGITVTTAAPNPSAIYGSTFPVAATATSGLPVAITTTGGCSGGGSGSATITMTSGTASCIVHYNQAGNGSFGPAAEVTSTTTTSKAILTVTGITASDKIYDKTTAATLDVSGANLVGAVAGDVLTLNTAGATGTFANATVGAAKTVTVAGLTASGANAVNYTVTQPTTAASITAKPLTVTGLTAANKAYDRTTGATLNTGAAALAGVISGDTVTLSTGGATGTFADFNVGAGKVVTVSGLTISGTSAANYTLTQPTTTASITAKPLTVTGITAASRPYDGTTIASINAAGAVLVGVISGDTVTIDASLATGMFVSKTVGTNKVVTVAGVSIGGASSANYTLTQPTTTASITALGLTVTGITAADKVYDRTTAATLDTSAAVLSGVLAGDTVTLNAAGATGAFASSAVGTGKTVTISGLTIGGADATNYTLTPPTATAAITAKPLTITGTTVNNKPYDGTTAATVVTTSSVLAAGGVISGDTVTLVKTGVTGVFTDKNAGTAKTVTIAGFSISGTSATNYSLSQPSATADITSKSLTVTGITANSRPYDRTTTATLNTGGAALSGVVSGDTVTFDASAASGAFANKSVGVNKVVTIAGITTGGADAANYSVTPPTATASITAVGLTITGITAADKIYDGAASATLNTASASLAGVISGDVVTLTTSGAAGAFGDKTVGTGKTVTVSGLTIAGADSGNYTITQPATTASITAKPLTVTGITASNRAYDGTTAATLNIGSAALSGKVSGDVVMLSAAAAAGTFADKTVGTAKTVTISGVTISGADAANYTVTQPTATANLTPKTLTVTGISANDKVYDANATATLSVGGAALSGVIGGDNVTLVTAGAAGTFASVAVGSNKTVTVSGLTLGGPDAANYTVTQPSTTASITQKPLTVTGITANNKTYDGSTMATLTTTGAALVGIVSDDNVQLNVTNASGTFADKNVGTGKSVQVSGVALGGMDKNNYSIVQPTAVANITAKTLTVTGITASNKIYDGTTTAVLNFSAATLAGKVGADAVTLDTSSAAGAFADKNVGNTKTVTVTGLALNGADSGNYTLSATPVTTSANITPKSLTVTGAVAQNKQYDGATTATINFGAATLVGVISPDLVSINSAAYQASFATKTVGTAKPVTVTGVALAGADAGNYTVVQPAGLAADITARTVTGSFTAQSKQYDGGTTATILTETIAPADIVGTDVVTLTGGTAAFATKTVGTAKIVTLTGAVLGGADAGNYVLGSVATTTADITAKHITGSFTAADRPYDGTAGATVLTRALAGVISPDAVTLDAGTAAFADKNVGMAKVVTLTGATLGGVDAGNYVLDSVATAAANITALHITGSFTTSSRAYDGTTTATIGTRSLTGAIGSDAVMLTGGTAAFADKNVGMGKVVTLTGATLGGTDAGNYVLDSVATTTANITALHITGSFTANSKPYDGTASATIATRALAGVLSPDTVTLDGGTATFNDKNVGVGKLVTLSGAMLGGTDAGDYVLDSVATTTANITAIHITGSFTANNKPYDGTTAATVLTRAPAGVLGADVVTLDAGTATFDDKNVGMGKVVTLAGATLGGADAGNYVLDSVATTMANITALHITGSFTASSKTYDGTTTATVVTRALAGAISPDMVTLYGGTATFDNRNAGNNKVVTLTGATLAGADAANYVLDSVVTTTANITPLTITGAVTANNKPYDGNTSASIATRSLTGVINPDDVTLTGGIATFGDANVGTHKLVTVTALSLAGTTSGNYILGSTTATTDADITAIPATAAIIGDPTKPYDGNTNATLMPANFSLSGLASGESISVTKTTGLYNSAGVATATSVSTTLGPSDFTAGAGTVLTNYVLPTSATGAGHITPKAVTASIAAADKTYDGTDAAAITTCSLTGVVAGDAASVTCTGSNGHFASVNAGASLQTVTADVALAGSASGNYAVTSPVTTTALITPKPVTVTFTAADKVYDGTTTATVSACVIATGKLGGDDLTCSVAGGTFASANASLAAQTVSATATLGGLAAANYSVANPVTSSARINKAPATVSLVPASLSQTYTGSALAADATVSGATGTSTFTFSYKQAGVEVAPINAGSYAVVATLVNDNYAGMANGTLTINKAAATVSLVPASLSQTYSGSALAAAATVSGATGTSTFTFSYKVAGVEVAPINAGSYAVVATLVNDNYSGMAAGTLTINRATTITAVTGATANYSTSPQTVTLRALVSSTALPPGGGDGSVSFTVLDGVTPFGTFGATSYALGTGTDSGSAVYSAQFTMPADTSAGNYTINASFSGGPNFFTSNGTGVLQVAPADLLADVAAADADFKGMDSFDVLFGKGSSNTLLKLKNTNPGTFHYLLTLTNETGTGMHPKNVVDVNDAHGATITAFLTVPSLPTNVGWGTGIMPSAALPFTDLSKSAFTVQGGHPIHARPDDKSDDMPMTVKWLSSLPAGYSQCSQVPDPTTGSPWATGQPGDGTSIKCVKLEGLAIPKHGRAKIDVNYELALKNIDSWSSDAQTKFMAGFAFKSATIVQLDNPIASAPAGTYVGNQATGLVGAGQQVTAIGGFVFDTSGNGVSTGGLTTGAQIVKVYSAQAASCATTTGLTATTGTMTDGFFFVPVLDGVKWWVGVCNPTNPSAGAFLQGGFIDHKLAKKEFDEQDFYVTPMP